MLVTKAEQVSDDGAVRRRIKPSSSSPSSRTIVRPRRSAVSWSGPDARSCIVVAANSQRLPLPALANPDQQSRHRVVEPSARPVVRGSGSAARRWRRTEPSVQSCVFACETSTDAAGRRAPAVHSARGGVRRNEPDQAGDGEHRAADGAGGAAAVTAAPRPTTTSERGRVARVRVDPSAGMLCGHAEQIPVRRRHR